MLILNMEGVQKQDNVLIFLISFQLAKARLFIAIEYPQMVYFISSNPWIGIARR